MARTIAAATAGRIVDIGSAPNPGIWAQVKDAGFIGAVRYVPLPGNDPAKDIAAAELNAILDAGLSLLLAQHVRKGPWDPAEHSGAEDGQVAAQFARAAGYLPGCHLYLDLEDIGGTGAATKDFANAWADAVIQTGYEAGCYVGFSVPLTPEELFDLPKFNTYWSDPGPRQVAVRGFAMKQQASITIGGVEFDPDAMTPDNKGETPIWMTTVVSVV